MVQLAMDGHGRGNLLWDRAEAYMGNNFGNAGSAYYAVKNYYYGLFSFVKSLLLHDSNGDGIAEPIQMLHATSHPDIDWYSAEASAGAWTDGVARKLVNDQNVAGYWYGHNYSSDQYTMETGIAIIILNRTIFTAGAPVAVATATPNPAVAGQTITLSGQASYHQDAGKQIVSWEWDLDNNGTWDATGVTATISFPVVGNYPVRLRVTDDAVPPSTAETTVIVMVATPPLAPTAKAGGPYSFCPAAKPWFLDGTLSSNPDDGQHEPGAPGDFIKSFGWDLNGDGVFDNATGQVPDVTAFFTAAGPGNYLIQLKVTDNTLLSFPSSGLDDLTDTDSGSVVVRTALDPRCGCISNLAARPKSGKLQLTWTATGAHHYNVYRSTVSGGPYLLIASTASTYATYLDLTVVNGTTYYYVVRPAAINGDELCQSNQAMGRPVAIR